MLDLIDGELALIPEYLAQHVLVSACALAAGIVLGSLLVLLSMRVPSARGPALLAANLIQTIPGLALLALFYPLLLAISAITIRLFGIPLPAFGFLPSVLALTLYSILPILRNGITGLSGIDPAISEAARAVGMTPLQQLFWVTIPLASPVLMAGIRTAAVWTIGAATLTTAVGQTSLGNFIFTGLQTENWSLVLLGCAAAAILALLVDWLLGQVEFGILRRNMARVAIGLIGIVIGIALAIAPLLRTTPYAYTIGAKNFSEQFILAELLADVLVHQGFTIKRKYGLGSAVAFRALANGDIDVYIDYSGTLWLNEMGRDDLPPREQMLEQISRFVTEKYGIRLLGSLGFQNSYALAMLRSRSERLGIRTLQDLALKGKELVFGADLEFLSRIEWNKLRAAYGLSFRSERSFTPTIMYRALNAEEVDVISAFSSDGRIVENDLIVLNDTKMAIPNYDAVILISGKRVGDAAFVKAISLLVGRISIAHMREANFMVDRGIDKRSPKEAANFLVPHVIPSR